MAKEQNRNEHEYSLQASSPVSNFTLSGAELWVCENLDFKQAVLPLYSVRGKILYRIKLLITFTFVPAERERSNYTGPRIIGDAKIITLEIL